MKKISIGLLLSLIASTSMASPNLTIATTTTSRDFPLNSDTPLVVSLAKDSYTLKISGIEGDCQANQQQKVKFSHPIQLSCSEPLILPLKIRFTGDYAFHFDADKHTLLFNRQAKASSQPAFKRPLPKLQCEQNTVTHHTIQLADTFPEGTLLREVFSQQQVTVQDQQVTLTVSPKSGGLMLLEPYTPEIQDLEIKQQPFTYKNANIYFVMVDRFNNGDRDNDQSYGRRKDGRDEVGTFHGGDLKGVINKLDYIQSLGTDAIWLSPIVEQVHGFVGGGDSGSFPFYAYHGYWTRDFTKIDENFGQDEDLKALVDGAHQRGMKVLLDAVINHSGYATLADLQFDDIDVINPNIIPTPVSQWTPQPNQNWHDFHQGIDYKSDQWSHWWGGDWVRAGLPNYPKPGSSDITMTLAGLPDFLTESDEFVTPPSWLMKNPGTRVEHRDQYTVSDYLIEWQTDWVKRFGIDGFRVDTVKHVESDEWKRLKHQASENLERWRSENNTKGQPFWMMGEVWGHSAYRTPYFDDGFDALINFDMQKKLDKGAVCFSQMAETYQDYTEKMQQSDDFLPVSYMSSHDTELFFSRFKSFDIQRNAANALLLSPGAVQVYYGDEVARNIGPYADDFHQGTRSDMVWTLDAKRQSLLTHWQTLGQFRQRHPAIGAGTHMEIQQDNAYVFSRQLESDKVVVAFVGH
ncbi:alpha-amylase [Vibrio genomosp. F10 str. 9ZC157]|uniref:alpha-amylase n=1 Tax=Vibrio genomosp. F10 TaxID=723171 RepID=UPI0002E40F3A|nr:alpha-amylase [Vibrio genomosp. F10]OEE98061.1 alpha-amylase [Vibrio genomosp. F10 str. 9ZC157]